MQNSQLLIFHLLKNPELFFKHLFPENYRILNLLQKMSIFRKVENLE